MTKKTALITGAHGFIGKYMGLELARVLPDFEILGTSRQHSDSAGTVHVDILDPTSVSRLVSDINPRYIFHLSGVLHTDNFLELYRGNVEATINVLEAVKNCSPDSRVIIPGSAAEYGKVKIEDLPLKESCLSNPVSPYGLSKVWQTTTALYYASQGIDVIVGRIFNVLGQGASTKLSIGAFEEKLKKIKLEQAPPRISVGSLSSKRDFIDVSDACSGLIALAQNGRQGEVYNICSGRSISMERILHMMMECLNLDVVIEQNKAHGSNVEDIFGSNDKLSKETGWRQTLSIEKSIQQIMDV